MFYRVKPPPTMCKVPAMDRKLKNNRQQQKNGACCEWIECGEWLGLTLDSQLELSSQLPLLQGLLTGQNIVLYEWASI